MTGRLLPRAGGPSSRPTREPSPEGGPDALALPCLLLLAGLTAAIANQGAYYGAAQWPVALLVLGAAAFAFRRRPPTWHDVRFPAFSACIALAGWALIRGVAAGHSRSGVPTAILAAGLVVVVLVSWRTVDRKTLAGAAIAVGGLAAATGWIGLAWRIRPWALLDGGVWRAATSVTYANAAAALLVPLALLSLGRLVDSPRSVPGSVSAFALLVGAGATMSRGGALAFAVGTVVLSALAGVRAFIRAVALPVIGAGIAMAALIPSVPADAPTRPLVATLGLVAGLLVAASVVRSTRVSIVATVVLLGSAAAVLAPSQWQQLRAVSRSRATLASPDRSAALDAAMRVVAEHPLAGAGPGQAQLFWTSTDDRVLVAKYAHNEYLQVWAELGAVGLALVVALMASLAWAVRGGPGDDLPLAMWAGGAAGLAALAVASAFDFLWHVPVVPLFGALLVGITTRPSHPRPGVRLARDPA